jgi:hypothetical protein
VDEIRPPITTRASGRWISAPMPWLSAAGRKPTEGEPSQAGQLPHVGAELDGELASVGLAALLATGHALP